MQRFRVQYIAMLDRAGDRAENLKEHRGDMCRYVTSSPHYFDFKGVAQAQAWAKKAVKEMSDGIWKADLSYLLIEKVDNPD